MANQLDYIVAAGIFIIVVASVILFSTNHLTSSEGEVDLMVLRSKALSIVEGGYAKENINSSLVPDIFSKAYHFVILVNNTNNTLNNEEVYFNFTEMGHADCDFNSTAIYDNGTELPYQIDNDRVKFLIDIGKNESKYFDVYFDDNSNFTDKSVVLNGVDNLTEKIYPVNEINLVQYKKIQELNSTGYDEMSKNIGSDFKIMIEDLFSFGSTVPRKSNVVSLRRYVIYQNKTGSINNGEVIVNVW